MSPGVTALDGEGSKSAEGCLWWWTCLSPDPSSDPSFRVYDHLKNWKPGKHPLNQPVLPLNFQSLCCSLLFHSISVFFCVCVLFLFFTCNFGYLWDDSSTFHIDLSVNFLKSMKDNLNKLQLCYDKCPSYISGREGLSAMMFMKCMASKNVSSRACLWNECLYFNHSGEDMLSCLQVLLLFFC